MKPALTAHSFIPVCFGQFREARILVLHCASHVYHAPYEIYFTYASLLCIFISYKYWSSKLFLLIFFMLVFNLDSIASGYIVYMAYFDYNTV